MIRPATTTPPSTSERAPRTAELRPGKRERRSPGPTVTRRRKEAEPSPLSRAEGHDDRLHDLVRSARAGDASAFRRLVEACLPRIHRWALARTADPDAADEVVQRVLIRLHRYLDGWDGRGRFESWLYRVTANAAASLREETAGEAEARGADPSAWGRRGGALPWRGTAGREVDPLARLWAADVAELVRAYFRELPPRQREVFDLADLQGYAPREIAEMLKMNPSTVRANLFKARRAIRRRVLGRHPELAEGYGR